MTKLIILLYFFILVSCSHERIKDEALNVELSRLEENVGITSLPDKPTIERLKVINSRFLKHGTTASVLVQPEKEIFSEKDTMRFLISYMKHTLKSDRYCLIVLNDSLHYTIKDEEKSGIFQFETVEFKPGFNRIKGKIIDSIQGETAEYESTIMVK